MVAAFDVRFGRSNDMNNILTVFMVGIGGFIGAIFRYLAAGLIHKLSNNYYFPYGTLGVNLLGAFLIGLLGGYADNLEMFSPKVRLFLFIGLLGGFTTFSTFGYETIALIRDREIIAAFANVGLHVLLGLFLVYLGYSLATLR